jgi:hypothetical protein
MTDVADLIERWLDLRDDLRFEREKSTSSYRRCCEIEDEIKAVKAEINAALPSDDVEGGRNV